MLASLVLVIAAPTELETTIARYVEVGSMYGVWCSPSKPVSKPAAQKFLRKVAPAFGMKDEGGKPTGNGKTDYWVKVAELNRVGESIFGHKNLFTEDHSGFYSTSKTKSGPTLERTAWKVKDGRVTASYKLLSNMEFGGFPDRSAMGAVSITASTTLPAPRIHSFSLTKKGDKWANTEAGG